MLVSRVHYYSYGAWLVPPAEALAPALSRLSQLAELHLHHNEIGDAGCLRLLTALPPLSPLHTLNLSFKAASPR